MQDAKPEIQEELERVGVTGLRTLVTTKWKGREHRFVPKIELVLDLSREKRGIHMSRLVEAVAESIEVETGTKYPSLEELGRHILMRVREKHPYKKAEISIDTELMVPKKTPVTKRSTMEVHNISISVINEYGNYRKKLSVNVVGNTVCPHALKKSKGISHVQRARCILELLTDYDNRVELEDMISLVESSFPSEVYTLLKTSDEQHLVKKMFQRPKFVEDVTREVLRKAKKKFRKCEIKAKTTSEESIHRHDVLAEGYARS